jgi:hypothetical protein
VKFFLDRKIDAYGLEGTSAVLNHLVIPEDRMYFADLRKELQTNQFFDLLLSIEVTEHIEPCYADTLVSNLCSLSNRLLLTIAGPGQKGHGHVNLQPIQYWETKFADHGFLRRLNIEDLIVECYAPFAHNRWVKTIIHNLIYLEREPL